MHKRITSSVRCGLSFSYQLCKQAINTTKKNPENTAWVAQSTYLWDRVTCPECLALREATFGRKKWIKRKNKSQIENGADW